MTDQGSIDESGKIIEISCLTHDLSLPEPSGFSVNKRVIDHFLAACLFGFALRWMVYYIVGCQIHYQGKMILRGKYDMKTAYHQAHLQLATSVACLDQLDGMLYMMLRFPFGGAFPAQWCTITEPIFDLANEMIHYPTWNQSSLLSCYSDVLPVPDRSSMVGSGFQHLKEPDRRSWLLH
jgi:hypothetical protein